ncbi:MAG: metallophosphoesterase [Planctomycetaceae bacterium]|nr:metallophosphoesterase [Planctomycetaceae bacterium]
MITNIREDRLLVVSDTHLGNPMFNARRQFVEFLRYACANDWNVCINGDGVDIVQTTIARLSRDLSECAGQLRAFTARGLRVYYTVGNHDISLEHFLDDWDIIKVVPFLNVKSGDKRIRIEHGHLYDESFVNYPRIYRFSEILGGILLRIHPKLYRALEMSKPVVEGIGSMFRKSGAERQDRTGSIPNEPPSFQPRAEEIATHGFDYVLFGHTHFEGEVRLNCGATYINTGSWLFEPHFAQIENGDVALRKVAELKLKY